MVVGGGDCSVQCLFVHSFIFKIASRKFFLNVIIGPALISEQSYNNASLLQYN